MLGRAQLRQVYLPWAPGIQPIWSVASIRGALNQLELGQFSQASLMIDAMGRDDRISSTLDSRIQGLIGLPFSVDPYTDDEPAQKLADEVGSDWHDIVPPCQLYDLLRWYHMIGFGLAELRWEPGPDKWACTLFVHHPKFVYHIQHLDEWHLITQEGDVIVEPGNGKWLLMVDGRFGYYKAAARALSIPWLVRQFALRDWARQSERHGMPIVKAMVPAQLGAGDEKEQFIEDIRTMATETTIMLPQNVDGQGGGFDVTLLETTGSNWKTFDDLLASCNQSIAIYLLGQNLTTEVQGGSFAAAGVHERVLDAKVAGDGVKLKNYLHHQVMNPYCAINYGAEAGPWPCWQTEAPDDEDNRSRVIQAVLTTLETSPNISRQLDIRKLLEQFGLPLDEEPADEEQKLGELFQYHFEYGIVTINEARARLGLAPIAGGDEPPKPLGNLGGDMGAPDMGLSSVLLSDVDPDQRNLDSLVADSSELATKDMTDQLDSVLAAIEASESEAELKKKLLDIYGRSDSPELEQHATEAALVADLTGRNAVKRGMAQPPK